MSLRFSRRLFFLSSSWSSSAAALGGGSGQHAGARNADLLQCHFILKKCHHFHQDRLGTKTQCVFVPRPENSKRDLLLSQGGRPPPQLMPQLMARRPTPLLRSRYAFLSHFFFLLLSSFFFLLFSFFFLSSFVLFSSSSSCAKMFRK